MSEYIVEMKNITKRFPGIIANKDVSVSVKKGEILAILGENGAGKSTLMSMLFGMYEPDEGEIYVRGEKVTIDSPMKATELNIGMVHQHFKLVSNYTITENIIMGMEPTKKVLGIPVVDIKTANAKIAELSEKYGLEVNPTDLISDIPVSTQQRVEILKMLYREAEILIFDEPTAVLTPQEIDSLLEIIRGLRESGKTVILITHKLNEIKQVADRCVILKQGELVGYASDKTPGQEKMAYDLDVATTSTKTMANLMVGREVSFEVEKAPAKLGDVVLKVDNLTVSNQDKFEVVKNASFEVHAGEILAIAGVSGNGQVDIADAVAGTKPVKSGKVFLNGEDITALSIRDRAEKGIAYIPEDRHGCGLIMDFDLSDNLGLKKYHKSPFSIKGILKKNAFNENADRLISEHDIRSGQGKATIVRSMSGGNQQKAIIAREVDTDADLIIYVQPTRGLDIGAIEKIRKDMIAQRDAGKAILLISLELDEVMNCADTISVIYGGVIQNISPASSLDEKKVGEYMMGVSQHE